MITTYNNSNGDIAEAENGSLPPPSLSCLFLNELDIDRLPPFQCDEDSPYHRLLHVERNEVMRLDLL